MATAVACSASLAAPAALSVRRSEISGAGSSALKVSGLPSLTVSRRFNVQASSNKKINTKQPFGPSGGTKFRDGVDASGRKTKGKGVYQYSKKYGANVDGYSPIYVEEEWSPTGSQYAGGQTGLALWALTLGALLVGGILLVYNTSALA